MRRACLHLHYILVRRVQHHRRAWELWVWPARARATLVEECTHARRDTYRVYAYGIPYLALETPRDEPLEARERAGRDEQDVARVHWDRVAHRARALAARPAHRALRHEHLRALQHLQQRLLHTFAAHVAHLLYNTSVLHFTLNFSCNSTIRNTVLRVISLKLRTKNLEIFCKLIFV